MSAKQWVAAGYLDLGDGRRLTLYRKPSGSYAVRPESGAVVVGDVAGGLFHPRGKLAALVNGGQPTPVGGLAPQEKP